MVKMAYIYIMTNKNRTTLYIGVTNDLCRRVYEHKNHLIKNSFTDKYNLEYCIYFEEFPYFDLAIQREKELKKWNRQKKEDLINKTNPEWKVLVTENGFIREKVSFSKQVDDILQEFLKNQNDSTELNKWSFAWCPGKWVSSLSLGMTGSTYDQKSNPLRRRSLLKIYRLIYIFCPKWGFFTLLYFTFQFIQAVIGAMYHHGNSHERPGEKEQGNGAQQGKPAEVNDVHHNTDYANYGC
jgi:putative endonuclease